MFHAFLIKYGEIGIKGKNRHLFEDALVSKINDALCSVEGDHTVYKTQGRVFVEFEGDFDYDDAVAALKRVFGIVGICPMVRVDDKSMDSIRREAVAYMGRTYRDRNKTFKVKARRADKKYPFDSMEIDADIGGAVLEAYPEFKVDVHEPEILLQIEVREQVYIYSEIIPGPGGMPVGTSGKGMLLLSGGIDSPVAGYMIARRGAEIFATYFHAPPYTSERAKQKVIDLASILSAYTGPITLHIVNFTEIQLYIYEQCPHEELTIIMRRYMMRIAEAFAEKDGCLGLITGESIGQVASQTMKSLAATDEVCSMPVYRPLIGFDKSDIIRIAEKVGTFETSILPYEDCCTIFVAKHPVTKPNINIIHKSETKLNEKIDEMFTRAVDTAETIVVGEKQLDN